MAVAVVAMSATGCTAGGGPEASGSAAATGSAEGAPPGAPPHPLAWFKSSYSTGQGGDYVEAAAHPAAVHIRDSKVDDGPILTVRPATWPTFHHRRRALTTLPPHDGTATVLFRPGQLVALPGTMTPY